MSPCFSHQVEPLPPNQAAARAVHLLRASAPLCEPLRHKVRRTATGRGASPPSTSQAAPAASTAADTTEGATASAAAPAAVCSSVTATAAAAACPTSVTAAASRCREYSYLDLCFIQYFAPSLFQLSSRICLISTYLCVLVAKKGFVDTSLLPAAVSNFTPVLRRAVCSPWRYVVTAQLTGRGERPGGGREGGGTALAAVSMTSQGARRGARAICVHTGRPRRPKYGVH